MYRGRYKIMGLIVIVDARAERKPNQKSKKDADGKDAFCAVGTAADLAHQSSVL